MKRSPFALALSLPLWSVLLWPQSNSPRPQPAPATQKNEASASQAAMVTREGPPAGLEDLAAEPLVPVSGAAVAPVQPPQPKTEILDNPSTGLATDGHDPVLDPPPLPSSTTTLVGGTVTSVDHIHNRMTIAVFAGNHWKIAFDERTHIYRNGAETTQTAIQKGARVYVDTMLDPKRHEVLARNIRVGAASPSADANGQITAFDAARGIVILRDQISSVPVQFHLDQDTRIAYGSRPASLRDLKPGSLVHVRFSPVELKRGLAREITIIAAPGSEFTYVGKITYLDVHRGVLALEDALDQKAYEVHFDPASTQSRNDLAVGSEVRIVAIFEGNRYTAQSITLTRSAESTEKQ